LHGARVIRYRAYAERLRSGEGGSVEHVDGDHDGQPHDERGRVGVDERRASERERGKQRGVDGRDDERGEPDDARPFTSVGVPDFAT
jgi:hypothetical protein